MKHTSITTYAYGFPKLGNKREFKKITEAFWKKEVTKEKLFETLSELQNNNNALYAKYVDDAPNGEVSLYDPMLDVAIFCGIFTPKTLRRYYRLCRGKCALEMTKWFNTNYHYLVTDFSVLSKIRFKLNANHFALKFKKNDSPALIGPFTFLKLSKGIAPKDFKKVFFSLIDIYKKFINGLEKIQIDEPAFVMDLSEEEINLIKKGYQRLKRCKCEITLMTYYDDVDWIKELLTLPVSRIGLDFVRGKKNLEYVCQNGFPKNKTLIAGLVDGRNIWRNDIAESVAVLKKLAKKINHLAVSNAAPLYHLPITVESETSIPAPIKTHLAFAEEKLREIQQIALCYDGQAVSETLENGKDFIDMPVRMRVTALNKEDFRKKTPLSERRKIHDELLKLPLFPTTTIGSFPQTAEVRAKRAAFNKGELSEKDYKKYIHSQIDQLIEFQENLGLDVLVHGEFERTDMVEFFAQKLDGILTTQAGWIISYGTRTYRPPIIYGDVSRPRPMTLDEIAYAQSKTQKPVKGMLTGAVTIIAWSFCREDIPVSHVAYQIALCLKDEICDYEKAGIKIVQVDEAAFREKAPIKKKNWKSYFDWAVKSFNLTTNTKPQTQIHTHMCYSEFGEIIDHINRMDFDVISIEASRSKGDIIQAFEKIDFKRQIGLGVWDIHSPAVPSVKEMENVVRSSLKHIPKENFWLNPDCGLKTRDWPESEQSLKNLAQVAKKLRMH
ncbi:MAG: 5-methyltetrahydropteroyltriglutamate--homocysteine S-methyltransferase [Verrucomicrobiota bacterium]